MISLTTRGRAERSAAREPATPAFWPPDHNITLTSPVQALAATSPRPEGILRLLTGAATTILWVNIHV
ncbi:hypothetical protein E2C01_019312 [Portunus trituberculatus]|uniref:Uncharacterized protein n=1 Tax=Portunus trituberculatus TaxID=210409 RepID=A0A5B7DYP6_PORTR|nr:hypothetical protein [Portunus trituberculatus]